MIRIVLITCFSLINLAIIKCSQNGWPISSSAKMPTNWTGTWIGVMEAYPEGETGSGWNVTLDIGPYPTFDQTCTQWKSTFVENGNLKTVKDYRFCRGHGVDDLYIDEGNNVRINAQWIDDVLVSPFKYKGVFAIDYMRMREDVLEEEILITDDKPAAENVVVSMRAHSIHRMKMKKKSIF